MKRVIIILLCLGVITSALADGQRGRPDKSQADSTLFALLAADATDPVSRRLPEVDTNVRGRKRGSVFVRKGSQFQVESMRSDIYYIVKKHQAEPVNDARHPMETMNNILLGVVPAGQRIAIVYHHQYGGKTATLMMPFDELMAKIMPGKDVYCSITSVTTQQAEGMVVIHDPGQNIIHLMQVKVPLATITQASGNIEIELYSNIPQDNIRNLFGTEKNATDNQPQPTTKRKK